MLQWFVSKSKAIASRSLVTRIRSFHGGLACKLRYSFLHCNRINLSSSPFDLVEFGYFDSHNRIVNLCLRWSCVDFAEFDSDVEVLRLV